MDNKSCTSSRSPGDAEGEPVAKKSRLVLKTIIYDESVANQWLDEPPLEVWDHKIIPLLSLKDLALARPVCTFFEAYWQEKFSNNALPLRVGNDVATIDDVMGVIEILSSRREYTKLNPFIVLLGKGDHQITSSWTDQYGDEFATTLGITRNNITFVGTGIDTTTILGGFDISHQQNIILEKMTVTNNFTPTNSKILEIESTGITINDSIVELVDVAFIKCRNCGINTVGDENLKDTEQVVLTRCQFSENAFGIWANDDSNIKMTDCVIKNNREDGLVAFGCTVNVHGEATSIHSNVQHGVSAWGTAKVLIHLPSHHNTIYNNGDEDRDTEDGGTITNVED